MHPATATLMHIVSASTRWVYDASSMQVRGGYAYLTPGLTPTSEPNNSMGLDMLHNVHQVLHVRGAVLASHDSLVFW